MLDSVIRETLRIHPPIHSIMRKAHTDIPVPATLAAPSEDVKYVVPKGDIVLASPLVSQVDPAVWDESEKWEPLRWYDEKGVAALANKPYNEARRSTSGSGSCPRARCRRICRSARAGTGASATRAGAPAPAPRSRPSSAAAA